MVAKCGFGTIHCGLKKENGEVVPDSLVHFYQESKSSLGHSPCLQQKCTQILVVDLGRVATPRCKESWEAGLGIIMIDLDLGTGLPTP